MKVKQLLLCGLAILAGIGATDDLDTASANGGRIVEVDPPDLITLTGTEVGFTNEFGGFTKCHVSGDIELTNEAKSTTDLQNVKFLTNTCETIGYFEGCHLDEATTTVTGGCHGHSTQHRPDKSVGQRTQLGTRMSIPEKPMSQSPTLH